MNVDDLRAILRGHAPVCVSDPSRREAAVAVVVVPAGDRDSAILFIKRARHPGDPWSGQMALPGGRRDTSDQTLRATAIHETWEETRVDLRSAEPLGQLDDHAPVTQVLPPILVRPFVFALPRRPRIQSNAEVARHLWASVSLLGSSERDAKVRVRQADLLVSAYHVDGEVIWGMTHRIINGLLSLTR